MPARPTSTLHQRLAGPARRAAIAAAALALSACATPKPLQFEDVVQRGRTGQPAEQIIGAVRSSGTVYALAGSDFGKLAEVGVPPQALDYLQQSFIDLVDLLTRYWVTGESLGGCGWCYPQQVELTGTGAALVAQQSAPGRSIQPGRPMGMPGWYRWYTVRLPSISVEQVRAMVTAGDSEQTIVEAIHHARLTGVVGVAGLGRVATHPVAGLSGSQLARLRQEGVPDAVLDALQIAFVGQFVEGQRLHYQNWGHGPSFN